MSDHKPRKAVEIFAGKMEKRLQEKDEKYGRDGWLQEDCDIEYLAEKLQTCNEEIQEAIENSWLQNDVAPPFDLDKLCVDIANFAMMISDNLRHQSRVKWLTGNDTITGRNPHDRYEVSFKPSHTLFLLTNHKPHAPADDFAFWERMILFPSKKEGF